MKYFPKVSRGNVYLSPINPEDYEIWTKCMNDTRITDGLNQTKAIISLDSEKEFLEKYSKDSDSEKAFTIVNKSNNEMLWIIDLWDINHIDQTARLGVSIWNVEEHNKWYWTDAINAILLFWFHTLNLRNIDLHVFSFNKWAIRCYEKVWFKEYGRRKETHYCNWEFRDEIYMDITKTDREKKNKKQILYLSK